MYVNKFNRETDQEKILQFLQQHNFGILVTETNHLPQATHVPFHIHAENGTLYLQTHLARANPQWRSITADQQVLVIFQGPHTYISPRWYDHINVPTMNYMAVHVYGRCRIIEDPGAVHAILQKQIVQFEKEHIAEYNISTLPENFLKAEMRALVALEVQADRIEANFKLSQNRDEANYRNIITQLQERPDEDSSTIASEMKKLRSLKATAVDGTQQ